MVNRRARIQVSQILGSVCAAYVSIIIVVDQFFININVPNIIKVTALGAIIISALLGIYALILSISNEGEKTFPKKSKRFSKFFVNWYRKEGNLTLCCTDLDWLGENDNILGILFEKARLRKDSNAEPTLKIWLAENNVNGEYAVALRNANADIRALPVGAVDTAIAFSIREYNGYKSSILRFKGQSPDEITVYTHNSNAYTVLLSKICESFERNMIGWSGWR